MKLHDILYAAAFGCIIIGILAFDGWTYDRTSLAKSVLLILAAGALWYLGAKEDGRIRKNR